MKRLYPKIECPGCGKFYGSNVIERHRRERCGALKEDELICQLVEHIENVGEQVGNETAIRDFLRERKLKLMSSKTELYNP